MNPVLQSPNSNRSSIPPPPLLPPLTVGALRRTMVFEGSSHFITDRIEHVAELIHASLLTDTALPNAETFRRDYCLVPAAELFPGLIIYVAHPDYRSMTSLGLLDVVFGSFAVEEPGSGVRRVSPIPFIILESFDTEITIQIQNNSDWPIQEGHISANYTISPPFMSLCYQVRLAETLSSNREDARNRHVVPPPSTIIPPSYTPPTNIPPNPITTTRSVETANAGIISTSSENKVQTYGKLYRDRDGVSFMLLTTTPEELDQSMSIRRQMQFSLLDHFLEDGGIRYSASKFKAVLASKYASLFTFAPAEAEFWSHISRYNVVSTSTLFTSPTLLDFFLQFKNLGQDYRGLDGFTLNHCLSYADIDETASLTLQMVEHAFSFFMSAMVVTKGRHWFNALHPTLDLLQNFSSKLTNRDQPEIIRWSIEMAFGEFSHTVNSHRPITKPGTIVSLAQMEDNVLQLITTSLLTNSLDRWLVHEPISHFDFVMTMREKIIYPHHVKSPTNSILLQKRPISHSPDGTSPSSRSSKPSDEYCIVQIRSLSPCINPLRHIPYPPCKAERSSVPCNRIHLKSLVSLSATEKTTLLDQMASSTYFKSLPEDHRTTMSEFVSSIVV